MVVHQFSNPAMPRSGASPPSAAAMTVALWSIMPT
jgi:hypothetical protein